jgi:glucoamylase
MSRKQPRGARSLVTAVTAAATVLTAVPAHATADSSLARTAGLLGTPDTTAALLPAEVTGASYVPGSNVLRLPDGRWRYLPDGGQPTIVPADDPGALAQIERSRAWLATGTVPGRTPEERAAAERALLSMRLLTRRNGAVAAAWFGAWAFSWPRDSSFVAAAFARTGHPAEAYDILTYNARTQRADGTWEARTTLDGAGPPDGRHWQLDANGWVPWSIWQWYRAAPRGHRQQRLAALYPSLRKAADYVVANLDERGLPPASPDYWEVATTEPNIGTAAPLLAGLHASADLARRTGHPGDARTWAAAATRLSGAIDRHFAPLGYPRTIDGLHGRDSAITFMAPPFNPAPQGLATNIDDTYRALLRPNGGVVPGDDPAHVWANTWGPETGFFGLAWSATGQPRKAEAVVGWLLDHRNSLGELPEQINPDGALVSVVPLVWTGAIVLLTLGGLDGRPAPTPPAA